MLRIKLNCREYGDNYWFYCACLCALSSSETAKAKCRQARQVHDKSSSDQLFLWDKLHRPRVTRFERPSLCFFLCSMFNMKLYILSEFTPKLGEGFRIFAIAKYELQNT
jgi:hypothetical protein